MKVKILVGLLLGATFLMGQEGLENPFSGPFAGPTILSRGVSSAGRRGEGEVPLRFFAQVNSVYDTGLLPIATNAEGQPYSESLTGVEAAVGAYGYHLYRHSALGLDYRGNVRHYTQNSYYDGSDHFLTLDYSYQPTRKLTFNFRPTAGTFARNYGFIGYTTAPASQSLQGSVPQNEIFDNRNYFAQASTQMVYQTSARLSFSVTGDAFLVRRQSKALIDLNGFSATGDVAYRLTRAQSIFLSYNFFHFGYPGVYGSSDASGLSLGYATKLGRRVEFATSFGAVRVESTGTKVVPVPPEIADLVGQSTALRAFHSINYIPSIRASLRSSFRTSHFAVSYAHGISPGNGVYLTSRTQTLGAFFGYTASKRWDVSTSVYRASLSGVGFQTGAGNYSNFTGGGGTSYRLNEYLHLIARADVRRAYLLASGFQRDTFRLSCGVAFSPGTLPISIW